MRFCLLFILFLFFSLFSGKLFSYSFTEDFNSGAFWASFPVPMQKFVVDPSDGELLERLVLEAEEKWESAVGMEIWQIDTGVVVSNAYYGNTIRWSDNFGNETGYDPQSTLGVTVRHRRGNSFTRTEIILNGGLGYLRVNFNGILERTILHEMGHTIGLGHTNMPGIMQATLGEYHSLQDDDIIGMIAIIGETEDRQDRQSKTSGYLKFGSDNGLSMVPTCATISTTNNDSNNWPGTGFIMSLLFGVLLSNVTMRRFFS